MKSFLTIILVLFASAALAQPVEEWVARYNGPGNDRDYALALALDASGNAYVTGVSYGSGTNDDYATIKYSSSGNQLWVRRYNGPGNGVDWARALASDASGNVYVTGQSEGSGTDFDYATIKYGSSGSQLWVARYNGPGNYWDYALALALDASGNVYVTGASWGSHTNEDYATIKYDPEGNQLWVARYNGPGNYWDVASALALDASGNVYVTGKSIGSGSSADYATIKYDSDGNELWVRRYNGPGNDLDEGYALALDASRNVYVTGWSYGSAGERDYATIKYSSSGNQLWVRRYNGPGNGVDWARALASDASSNVYVTGWSEGSGTDDNYATIKYDSDGNQLWVSRYNGPGNDHDGANGLALDASGNIYVTGVSIGSGSSADCATIKYDSGGNQLWVARYNGPGNYWDEAYALALDASRNVYVTGKSIGSGAHLDYATIKYSQEAREWSVCSFINGDNNLERCMVHDLDEMELVGSSESMTIYAVLDRIPGEYTGHNNWTDTKVYEVQRDSNMNAINSTIVRQDFENDMGEEDSLSAFFAQGMAYSPASRYALTIHNHGSGWYKGKDGGLINSVSSDHTQRTSIGVVNGEWETAIGAIRNTLGRKLDLLLYDACLMQMWEVAYINKDYVQVQVGSEEVEWAYLYSGVGGVANNNWLDSLAANPSRSAVSLGRAVVQSAPWSGGTLNTQSALDLSQIGNLSDAIDGFALSLLGALPGYVSIIEADRSSCLEFYYTSNIDLWDFADRIAGDGRLPEGLRNNAAAVKDAVSSAVIEYYNSGGSYQRARGIAIYFPRRSQGYDQRYNNLNSSASTHWDDFLRSFTTMASDVEVSIRPLHPPIQIPPQGGSFFYEATLKNNTGEIQVVDAWAMARLPDYNYYGPVKLYENIRLRPFQSLTADNIRQNVPGAAPEGEYRYIVLVGEYPDLKMDSSYFDFTKLGTVGSYASKVRSWEVFGFFEEVPAEPLVTGLQTVYPNPFNTEASISYSIINPCWVRLEVFDLLGRKVATLVDREQPAGRHSFIWDASRQASGVYFYKLTAGDFTEVRRMTLLK